MDRGAWWATIGLQRVGHDLATGCACTQTGYNTNLSYYQHFNQMKWYRIENIKGAFHSIRVSIIS